MTTVTAFRTNDVLAIRVRAADHGETRPLRLALLLDVSDSMSDGRLAAVVRTLSSARQQWKADDRVTLVTFGDNATLVFNDHQMSEGGVQAFYTAVEALHTDGCTHMSAGLELVASAVAGRNYDSLIILTDGMVNRGVMTAAGLQAMALGIGLPTTTLGYGANHNRQLLRDLALRSHGSYTFCDSDEILPVIIGQLMAELRTRVAAKAEIAVTGTGSWTCQELGGQVMGSIVPDRDYWSVWRTNNPTATNPALLFTADGQNPVAPVIQAVGAESEDGVLVREQSLRARVAAALKEVADTLEQGMPVDTTRLGELEAEINGSPDEFRMRGLVLRLLGELVSVRAELSSVRRPPPGGLVRQNGVTFGPARLMARLSSETAYLSTQRGVSTVSPHADMFSSPAVRIASSSARAQYEQNPQSP
jgi:hypothetical protein